MSNKSFELQNIIKTITETIEPCSRQHATPGTRITKTILLIAALYISRQGKPGKTCLGIH